MNIVESLKADIEETKRICWSKDSPRQLLNQITIMEALVVLLEVLPCEACNGKWSWLWDDELRFCEVCNRTGKRYSIKKEQP